MSGYGMPQGSTPGSPRSGRNAPALPVLELVGVGLAVLAFIVAFLPWAKADLDAPAGVNVDAPSAKGWELPLPAIGVTVLLVAALLVAAPLLSKRAAGAAASASSSSDDESVSPVPALIAALGALLLLVFAIIGYNGLKRGVGTWLGLVIGLGTAAVLVLSWMQRTGRMKKPSPAAGPSNWNQGQPQQQGWGGQPYQQQQPPPAYEQQPPAYEQQPPAYEQQPPSYDQPPAYDQPQYGQGQAQPPAYPQQPPYGGQGGYPGPSTGGQPAQPPGPYGQEQYPPQSGQYPAQGGYHPQG
jgi:hypothetical protein